MDTMGKRLKRLRAMSGKTQSEIAQLLKNYNVKADRGTVARWETDKQVPTVSPIAALAKIYGVSMDFIGEGEPSSDSVKRGVQVRILGTIAAGDPLYCNQSFNDEFVSIPSEWDVDFGLRIKGTSMIGADIPDGSVVLCKSQDDVDDGEIAVCIIDGEEATLKRVRRYAGVLVLHPENPNMEDYVFTGKDKSTVKIIGLAKKVIKDL